jgi:hypothetical protein
MTRENHIATAEDFRQACAALPVERVVLPALGKAVLLRRPQPLWFLFHGQLPASLAARLQGSNTGISSPEDLKALADWMVPLLAEVFVQPRLSLHPGPDEIAPEWLDVRDANFIIRWAVGEITSDGRDLAPFRRESGAASASSDSPDLGMPAQRDAGSDGKHGPAD